MFYKNKSSAFSRFQKMLNKEKIFSLSLYLIIFLSSVFPYGDKDWGWHYKYGEYFFKHGKILTTDIFSWSMAGYEWINHSWAYDLLLYILTNISGFVGLSLAGALVNLTAFHFAIANFKLSYWKKAILALFFLLIGETGIYYGLRSQVVSTMIFGILMFLLIRSQKNIKTLIFLPILFLVWANMHGSFTLGLGVMGIFLSSYFLIDYYKAKKTNLKIFTAYTLTALTSFGATFINPFGYKIYMESFRHFSNPYLKNVYEWMPIYPDCSYCHPWTFFIYTLLILIGFAYFLKKKNSNAIPYVILVALLLFPTIDTRRLLPVFIITTLPFMANFLRDIEWNIDKYRIEKYLTILIIIVLLQFNLYTRFARNYNLYNFTEEDHCYFASGCSVKAVNYLISHPPQGKGLNFYDTGGYLIGKGISSKIFIDGRMHLWKDKNYQAFGEYIEMYYRQNYEKFKKYDFDWAFINNSSDLAKQFYSSTDLGEWKLEFRDGDSAYFVRVR